VIYEYNNLGSLSLLGFVQFSINAVFSILSIMCAQMNKLKPIVRAAQRTFLYTIAIGTIISSAAMVPLALQDDETLLPKNWPSDARFPEANLDALCMSVPWLYSLGFIITMSSLFLKTWRLHKIMNNQKIQRIKIQDTKLFAIIFILLIIDGSILLAWTFTSPLVWVRSRWIESKSEDGTVILSSTGSCGYDPTLPTEEDYTNIYIILIAAIHFILLCWGCVMLYQTRLLKSAFNEAKYVTVAMVSSWQLLVVGGLLIVIMKDLSTRFIVICGVVFFNDLSVLFCIFGPKIYALQFGGDMGDDENKSTRSKFSSTSKFDSELSK
jgi:hypothetical protein